MLDRPDLEEGRLTTCLRDRYGLPIRQVAFLPLGADRDTAVYRAKDEEGKAYLIKLRQGVFDGTAVALCKLLSDHGVAQVIAPLAAQRGELWVPLPPYTLILYPYVEGRNGYEMSLANCHWVELGRTLKQVHASKLPPDLASRIRHETYSAAWRDAARAFAAQPELFPLADAVAAELGAFLKAKRNQILDLVGRAERLALILQARPLPCCLCHSDVHAGNVLIAGDGALYIIDWDDAILAPKERDLMYAGAGLGGEGHTPQEEEELFYRGYGRTEIDPAALAYYRYERIVQDIAVFCQRIFSTAEGHLNRKRSLYYLKSNFEPNGTIDIAYQSDMTAERIDGQSQIEF
jgi:spectinomycin phosphotransferase